MKKSCLITGITGQDGSYLAEYLLSLGYQVHGILRRCSTDNTKNIQHILNRIELHYGDMTDHKRIRNIIKDSEPDEIYNLAAQSHVGFSFKCPDYTYNVNTLGLLNILKYINKSGIKLFQASSSEMFDGNCVSYYYNERSAFNPTSPYGKSKLEAHKLINKFRKKGNNFSTALSFNHESPRRSRDFVTQKIVRWFCDGIKNGNFDILTLGNIYAARDWGHAKEFVKAFHLINTSDSPCDYVVSTGIAHQIKSLVQLCFDYIEKEIKWEVKDDITCGLYDGNIVIISDKSFYRPVEVGYLCGDSNLIKLKLRWKHRISLNDIIKEMIEYGLNQ